MEENHRIWLDTVNRPKKNGIIRRSLNELKTATALTETWQREIDSLIEKHQKALDALFKADAEYKAIDFALKQVELSADEMLCLNDYSSYHTNCTIADKLKAEMSALVKDIDNYDREALIEKNNSLNSKIQAYIIRQSKLEMQLRASKNTSKNTACEVCGAPPEAQFKGDPFVIGNTLDKLRKERTQCERYVTENLETIQIQDAKINRIKEIERALHSINVDSITAKLPYYKELSDRYQKQLKLLTELEQAKINLTTAENNKQNITESYDRALVEQRNSEKICQNAATIEREANQAQITINRINELSIEEVTHSTIIKEKQKHLNSLNDLLKQVKQKKKQKKLKKYVELLEEVRTLTHRNNIPHIISKRFLYQLITQINAYLVQFDAPFMAIVGDDLGFGAEMNSGAMVSASALSGGQQCMLAMAFWLSVFQTNAGRTGLLVVDEPGDGLDEANRKTFNQLLQQVDEVFKKQGSQMLLVTHDLNIVGNFHTICV